MNKLTTEKRTQVVAALVEGSSIRATVRMTGVAKNTVVKLLADLGAACSAFHDRTVRNVNSKVLECDEIWSFVGAKKQNLPSGQNMPGIGDVWTWTALDADSKLMVSWLVGNRDAEYAHAFMYDLADRVSGRVQITTDGHSVYIGAVNKAFGYDVDYAQLVKHYGPAPVPAERTYSMPKCNGAVKHVITGNPDPERISTSYVERQNLTMRMQMRRFTRLTNAFSKKLVNHEHAVALHFTHYNFCRVHQTLRVTPAMEAGLTDHVWTIAELVGLLDA